MLAIMLDAAPRKIPVARSAIASQVEAARGENEYLIALGESKQRGQLIVIMDRVGAELISAVLVVVDEYVVTGISFVERLDGCFDELLLLLHLVVKEPLGGAVYLFGDGEDWLW